MVLVFIGRGRRSMGSWLGRCAVAVALVAAVAACGSEGNPEVASGDGRPGGRLVTPPRAAPAPQALAAVGHGQALVVVHRAGSRGEVGEAGLVDRASGGVRAVETIEGLRGVQPVTLNDGFAVFGTRCLEETTEGGRCALSEGVVSFLDDGGRISDTVVTPRATEGVAFFAYGGGAREVLVLGDRLWTAAPSGVEELTSVVGDAPCPMESGLIIAMKHQSDDPENPADTLRAFQPVRLVDGEWVDTGEPIPVEEGGATWPVCTPGGILVERRLVSADAAQNLTSTPVGDAVDTSDVVGFARNGKVLSREAPSPAGHQDQRRGWVGLSPDRGTALLANGARWEFVDVR
jgi:hypothetical protein